MKSNRIAVSVAGLLFFISIVLTSAWFLSPKTKSVGKISFDEALTRIKNKEVSEIIFKGDSVELFTKSRQTFTTEIEGGDAARTALFGAIDAVNREKPESIKTTLEQRSDGLGRFISAVLFPFFIMWGLTLAVIVYAVRTLSRNKG